MNAVKFTLSIGHNVAGFRQWSDETVESTVSANWTLPGFTLVHTLGRWEGVDEDATLVSYVGGPEDEPTITAIAAAIAADLRQDAVMLTAEPVRVAFIAAAPALRAEAVA